MGSPDSPTFTRPPLAWFVILDGGIVALKVLSLSPTAYGAAAQRVPLPPRRRLGQMLAATAVIHLAEAAYAGRRARKAGLPARRWAAQTFVVGFPSLGALKRTVAARAA